MRLIVLLLLISFASRGQWVGSALPARIDKSQKFLFYFHGQVVTELGDNAINSAVPEWGPYQFTAILDSLKKRGYNVISEIRKKGVENSFYTEKTCAQIDSLLRAGVKEKNIILVGASSGWDIVLNVSSKLKNRALNYVIMGGCWPQTYKDYVNFELYGNFFSIIERSDPHGTCQMIFEGRKSLTSYKETMLDNGRSHGFFYKGYKDWIDLVVKFHK